jgi:arylsulfatase A-like enzyme
VFVTDDQRADPDSYRMLDKTVGWFRRGGTQYTNMVVSTPLCCPSRAQILSGRYGHNTHVNRMNDEADLDTTATLEHDLKAAGYQTAIAGKYLNVPLVDPPYFDRWSIFDPNKSYSHVRFNVQGRGKWIDGYLTTFLRRRALDYVSSFDQAKPWFLYVAPYAPHEPATPERKYARDGVPPWREDPATGERDISDKPAYVRRFASSVSKNEVEAFREQQLRSLESADDLMWKVIDWVQTNARRPTLVFFLSDNGYLYYEHHLTKKFFPYDPSVRVPLFVRWIDGPELPPTDARVALNVDIAPTVYDVAGLEPSYVVDGRSIFGADRRRYALLEFWRYRGLPAWRALWTPRWEYIEYPGSPVREYYGRHDPSQLHNVYSDRRAGNEPRRGPILHRRLVHAVRCSGRSCP